MDESHWRHWAEGENRALRGAIRSAAAVRVGGGGSGVGGVAVLASLVLSLGLVAIVLGILFVVALPILYPSYLVGRLVADTIHPLPGILVGLGLFVAGLAALYFSRLARAVYAFPFVFVGQLALFLAVGNFSDLVWATGAALPVGLLGYMAAFALVRARGDDRSPPLPAWRVSGALAIASLAPNFVAAIYWPDLVTQVDITPPARARNQAGMYEYEQPTSPRAQQAVDAYRAALEDRTRDAAPTPAEVAAADPPEELSVEAPAAEGPISLAPPPPRRLRHWEARGVTQPGPGGKR